MKNLCKFIVSVIFAWHIAACTERIDIKLDEGNVRLVVEGSVTTDTMVQKIILTKTTSYYYSQKAPAVTGASVIIRNGVNLTELHEDSAGVYETDPGFFGIEGETYTLEIKLDAPIGGYGDYSATSTMNKAVKIDSARLVFQPGWSEQGMWEVKVYFKDPPEANYYRFLISRNGKLITDTLDKWYVTDDLFFNGSSIVGSTISVLDQASPGEKLDKGDEVTIEMDCIDRSFAEFAWEAQAELRGSNPLFSGPPANVRGNINNGAIGFFSAYATSRTNVTVSKK